MLYFKFDMQFFQYPGDAYHYKGKADAVDKPHEAMREPVGKDVARNIGKAVKDVGYQVSGKRGGTGRLYQVEPARHSAADQVGQRAVDSHRNGNDVEYPGGGVPPILATI